MMPQSWDGVTIGGRYQIETLLGQGGMSAVYRAYDPNLRRAVAVKLIHPHLSTNPDFVERFKEEAAAVARLRHPNIVQVHDFNNEGPTYYMVMEYLAGETLQARLKRLAAAERFLSVGEALRHALGICDAASYAHNRGLIHRDIKPANVMLDIQGQAILMDFGIVKIVGGQYHTGTGATVGTAMYMSPEQIRGERVDERADIYSLGVMLFEMLGGRPPYEADSALTVMMMHLNDPVPNLSQMRPEVPRELMAVIEKALAKDRVERYQSAAEMMADLRRIQDRLLSEGRMSSPRDETITEQKPEPPLPAIASESTVMAAPVMPLIIEASPAAVVIAKAAETEEATVVDLPAVLPVEPPLEPALEQSVGQPQRVSKRMLVVSVAVLLLIGAAVVAFTLLDARKPPEIALVPIETPAQGISEQTLGAFVKLGSWYTDSAVEEVDFSLDSTRVLTANDRDWVRFSPQKYYLGLWQVGPGELDSYLQDHTLWINSASFSTDGQTIISSGEDKKINLWSAEDGSLLLSFEAQEGVTNADLSPNNKLIVSGTWDGVVRLWQASNGNLLREMEGHENSIRDVEFSPDGLLIASASDDNTVRVWRVSDGNLLHTLEGHTDKVYRLAFSPDGTLLASASEDHDARIWEVETGSLVHTLQGHSYGVSDVAFSPDGALLASGAVDDTLRLWRVQDGTQLSILEATGGVLSVDFSPDGKLLVSASADGLLNFWGVSEAIPIEETAP